MQKLCLTLLASAFLAAISCRGDGGAIIARESVNGLDVTVFASPVPLRAGPVDVSVLLQEGDKLILDAAVEVAWKPGSTSLPEWLPPCCTMDSHAETIPALRAHSNNRFLYSAIVPMKSAGPSELVIRVSHCEREAAFSCDIDVQRPTPPVLAFWPWLVLPPVAIAGFAFHQSLTRSRPRGGSMKSEDPSR
jgi:hypothetical protein